MFVDAYDGKLPDGVRWQACPPSADFQFSTHALPPRTVLSLCRDLYQRVPPAMSLMIQGADWQLETGLSPTATANLDRAQEGFQARLGA